MLRGVIVNVLVVGCCGYPGGTVTDLPMNSKDRVPVYNALLCEASYRTLVDLVYGDVRDRERLPSVSLDGKHAKENILLREILP